MSDLLLQGLTNTKLTEVDATTNYATGKGWWASVLNGTTPAKFWLRGIYHHTTNKFGKVSYFIQFRNSKDLIDYFEAIRKKVPTGSLIRYPDAVWKNPINEGCAYVNPMVKEGNTISRLWNFIENPEKPTQLDFNDLQEGDLLSLLTSFSVNCSEKSFSVKMTVTDVKLLSRGNFIEVTDIHAPPTLTKEEQEIVENFQKEEISKKVKVELFD